MGVRPPQQGDDVGPETVAFGIAALDDHLGNVSFPATDDEIVEVLGDPAIPYDAMGNEMRLSEALEQLAPARFENRQAFLNAIHPVFEEKRERGNNSVLGQLRSLLPF